MGGGGRKGRGVLLWKAMGDKRRGRKMKGWGRDKGPGSEFGHGGYSCVRLSLLVRHERPKLSRSREVGEEESCSLREGVSLGVLANGEARAAVAGSSANPSNLRRTTDAASKMDYLT